SHTNLRRIKGNASFIRAPFRVPSWAADLQSLASPASLPLLCSYHSIGRTRDLMSRYNLTHLKQLEAESIHIIREVAAEFEKPVMLYSIGKDSSVMVRLAQKAFYPGRLPFPL